MDSDQVILNSALGTTSLTKSDSTPPGSTSDPDLPHQSSEAKLCSDSTMQDATAAIQSVVQSTVNGESKQDESGVTGPSGANESGATGASRHTSQHEEEVAQLGFAVQFVVQGLRNGAGPTLMPLLVKLLPFLLKTQVSIQCCHP